MGTDISETWPSYGIKAWLYIHRGIQEQRTAEVFTHGDRNHRQALNETFAHQRTNPLAKALDTPY